MVDQTPDIAEETVPPEDGLQPQDVAVIEKNNITL